MSISVSITGVRDLDGKFAKMAAVKAACEAAGIDYPPEVKAYFNYPGEGITFLRKSMEEIDLPEDAIKRVYEDGGEYWTVDLSKVPAEAKSLRFALRK